MFNIRDINYPTSNPSYKRKRERLLKVAVEMEAVAPLSTGLGGESSGVASHGPRLRPTQLISGPN